MTNSMNDTNTPNNNPSEPFVLPSLDELAEMTNALFQDKPYLHSDMIQKLTNEQKIEVQKQIEGFEKKYDITLPDDFKRVQFQYDCDIVMGFMFSCSNMKSLDNSMNDDWVDPEVAERPKNLICLGGGNPYYYMLNTDTGGITVLGHDLVTEDGLEINYFPIADNFELLLRGSLYAELKRWEYFNNADAPMKNPQIDKEALKEEMIQVADAISYAVGGSNNYHKYWRDAVDAYRVDYEEE